MPPWKGNVFVSGWLPNRREWKGGSVPSIQTRILQTHMHKHTSDRTNWRDRGQHKNPAKALMTMRSAMLETMGFWRFSPLAFGKSHKWLQQRNHPLQLCKLDMFAFTPMATCFICVPVVTCFKCVAMPNFTSPAFLVKVHSKTAPILFEVLVKGGLSLRCASQFQNCIKRFHSEVAVSK